MGYIPFASTYFSAALVSSLIFICVGNKSFLQVGEIIPGICMFKRCEDWHLWCFILLASWLCQLWTALGSGTPFYAQYVLVNTIVPDPILHLHQFGLHLYSVDSLWCPSWISESALGYVTRFLQCCSVGMAVFWVLWVIWFLGIHIYLIIVPGSLMASLWESRDLLQMLSLLDKRHSSGIMLVLHYFTCN